MGKRKTMGNKEKLRHAAKGCRTEQTSQADETIPAPCPDAPVYQTYKDRVFRMLFKDRKNLLELYNALNGTDYANEDELTVNILENAIFIKMCPLSSAEICVSTSISPRYAPTCR
jgi:hypothetical protein